MDMSRHLRRWLNDAELARREHGAYEGTIADVVEEVVRNPYTTRQEEVPVVVFADGWRLVPNFGMRAQLVAMFGAETDAWRGKRIRVFRRRTERTNKTTGETREVFVKTVMSCDTSPAWRPVVVARETGARELADYDDSDEAIVAVRGRQ
jgi:hypothetical protein